MAAQYLLRCRCGTPFNPKPWWNIYCSDECNQVQPFP